MLQLVGRAHHEEAERVARHEALEERLVHTPQILAHFVERVLRSGTELHGAIVGREIQIHQNCRLLALRQKAREIDSQGGSADAALRPQKTVNLAKLACSR